ncbi:histone cluster 1, H1b [Chelydra serpentina]|uniref:Histone cluster 1, H1b n=1 Tax=Chelydra serpentina TaxID=8475 RepID=A0A8T1S2D6_CHESE|nr:histone cluster 1, H1b [Chelydra serpentina]
MRDINSVLQTSSSEVALATLLSKKRGRPSLHDLILRAVCVSTARKGASLAAIKKALLAEGYDVQKNNGRLKAALSSLVSKGLLQRVTGSGVSGSFRVNKHQKKGGALKTTKKKTAVKRPKPQIVARRSPKKINLTAARKAQGPGRDTKPAVKKPKARKNLARPKGRAAPRGKAAVKRH